MSLMVSQITDNSTVSIVYLDLQEIKHHNPCYWHFINAIQRSSGSLIKG